MKKLSAKRTQQIHLLQTICLGLLRAEGKKKVVEGLRVIEVELAPFTIWQTLLGARSWLDVWYDSTSVRKVLNMEFSASEIYAVNFRRGPWEQELLDLVHSKFLRDIEITPADDPSARKA